MSRPSAQAALRQAVVDLLLAAPALAAGKVGSGRHLPTAHQDAATVAVYLEGSAPQEVGNVAPGLDVWDTVLRIECVARDTIGHTPAQSLAADEAADDLALAVHARLRSDPTLGGRCGAMRVRLAWNTDTADTAIATCHVEVTLTHALARDSLLPL